ncbi:zinc transporter ZupT [Stenotrophomonas maltophilia]|jgi:ZIP family zinc transporter|uniref:zinc transporter ZupT n=1 Tax=Stenotrophomonas TaxID=40323 RepID=UPI00201CE08D|nr:MULTISPECIES: zinc transporter ZupT [Stenotrophomonas]MBN5026197.1 zinc transporter ZupT [Stenotrophomonas maltophilia]MDH1274324.1 zinc transporter ZupT [Stenotrophomonas sp. GD03937]MDH1485633.1 zinc transporter ZupT [Stenotrophomonas sp. GD03712]MDR2959431.1 zinc transporter ZupT [Stenotrophomonas sp.]UQY95969.1 zinc transporter ZupT [Stenotrophomonas maltophilia]
MLQIPTENIWIALAVTLAAGLATAIGSLMVLFSRRPNPRLLAFGLAFAGGAMVYVSLSEILNKSIASFALAYGERTGFTYGTLAFLLGVVAIVLIDHFIPNPHDSLDKQDPAFRENSREYLKRVALLTSIAITAHNFPEGLATFFATLESPSVGMPLAFAIAIHNIPEGIAIAVPVYFATQNKFYAFSASLLSGLAEPVGAALGYWLLSGSLSHATFGWVFGLIAGVMVFLALDELLPAAKRYAKGHETVYGLVAGMGTLAISLVLFKW